MACAGAVSDGEGVPKSLPRPILSIERPLLCLLRLDEPDPETPAKVYGPFSSAWGVAGGLAALIVTSGGSILGGVGVGIEDNAPGNVVGGGRGPVRDDLRGFSRCCCCCGGDGGWGSGSGSAGDGGRSWKGLGSFFGVSSRLG